MKLKSPLLLLSLLVLPFAAEARERKTDQTTGKSFFSVNPQYTTGKPEHLSLYRENRMHAREDGVHGSLQAVVFGGKSVNTHGMARYFFPYQRTNLVVAEGPNPEPTSGLFVGGSTGFQNDAYDLLASNFNIATADRNFQSIISIRPEQNYVGCGLNYRQGRICGSENGGVWFDVTVPIVHVKNKVNLEERITTSSPSAALPGTALNMRAAFMNPEWNYGKIAPCGRGKTGVADAEIRIGRDFRKGEACAADIFVGFIIPGGNRPNGEYLFEPVIGRNKHWGFIWGGAGSLRCWENCDGNSNIFVNIDINNYYLFEGRETRSFDLWDKSWSRYINVFTDVNATSTTPGINVLTQKMKIKPHGTYQINASLTFNYGSHFQFEFGDYMYFREAEEGQLCGRWQEGPAIAGNSLLPPQASMSNATMKAWDYGLIENDADMASLHTVPSLNTPVYRPITECDLNLQSALHPFCGGHMVYGTLGYQNKCAEYPWLVALGTGYQCTADNALMQRWSVWGKFAISI